MNYYEHHLRDYDAATSHLTWDQDMAYTRLLRWYYRKESPLPPDVSEVCRLIRATTKVQRSAVDSVLKEFFALHHDGWHKDTCDEAIRVFQAGAPEREAKRKNEDTRLSRHRAERAGLFGLINSAGYHLPYNAPIAEVRALAQRVREENSNACNAPETLPATGTATPATHLQRLPSPQSPDTRHQTPDTNPQYVNPEPHAEGGSDGKLSADLSDEAEHAEWETTAALYPPGAARVDWIQAEKAARQLVEDGEASWEQLRAGLKRYAAHIEATNRLVLNPLKFFKDPDRPWSQSWPIPVGIGTKKPTGRIRTATDIAEEFEAKARIAGQSA